MADEQVQELLEMTRRVIEARIKELEAERDRYVLGAPDGTETPAPHVWQRDQPLDAEELELLLSLRDLYEHREMEGAEILSFYRDKGLVP